MDHEDQSPLFPQGITLGNVLAILTLLVGITLAWQTLASSVSSVAARLDKHDKQLEELATARLRQTEILSDMRADIRYLRQQVETKPK